MAKHHIAPICPECGSLKVKMIKATPHWAMEKVELCVPVIDKVTSIWKCKKCHKTFEETVMVSQNP